MLVLALLSWAPMFGLLRGGLVLLAAWGVAFALLAAAAAAPCLSGFVLARCRAEGRSDRIALTFDDGPDPASTPNVLAVLASHGARATFFVIGHKVSLHPELTRRIVEEGHEVACHGYAHDWRVQMSPRSAAADLAASMAAIVGATGVTPKLFRPPYGVTTPGLAVALAGTTLLPTAWSLRSWDTVPWGPPRARATRLAARIKGGDIVLMHDAGERAGGRLPAGPDMLPEILDRLAARGLHAVTVRELFA